MMKLRFGDKDLLDSKTFLALDLGEAELTLGEGAEALKLILEFVEEQGKKEELTLIPIDNKALRIRLTNWNNVLGTTLVTPLEIGTFNKRKLYIMVFVQKAGSTGQVREVTFCAYLGEAVQDGQN